MKILLFFLGYILGINFPDIEFCFPNMEDVKKRRIYLRFPMMPDSSNYSTMKEVDSARVLTYKAGIWSMELKKELEKDILIGPG